MLTDQEIISKAREAIRRPDSYFRSEIERQDVWGRIGLSTSNMSRLHDRVVTEALAEQLREEYPEDFVWISSSHWLVGHMSELLCRVVKEPVERPEDITDMSQITEAFVYACELSERFDPVWFEDEIIQAERESLREHVAYEWPNELRHHSDEDIENVINYLLDRDIYPGGDDGDWYSDTEIKWAGFHLGLWDMFNYEEEFWEFMIYDESANAFVAWCTALHNTPLWEE